ncbi:MAG: DAK2 domain-containing protein [Clostridia bacterium]|nr:DAK2 domain-containing protein [Clostridia bacterium]
MKLDGKKFSEMCISAANALNNDQAIINALNVFPVPDGDTGVNMSLTMSTLQNLNNFSGTVSECATKVADYMLRAARGNSGAILSLFFRGFAKAVKGLDEVDAADVARALNQGTKEAYGAVMTPTEGTILTVMRICAEHAVEATERGEYQGDIVGLFGLILRSANEALAMTPDLLPVLKEANVVDAGGSGFVTVLAGMLAALNGQPVARMGGNETSAGTPGVADFGSFETGDIKFAYCTECIVDKDTAYKGEGTCGELRDYLAGLGDSLVFIDDESMIKIHVHTNHPGKVLEKALRHGSLYTVKIENMRNQHTELIDEKPAAPKEPRKPVGFVSISVGEGVAATFRDLGVDYVVPGGQTMNPSTEDVLRAIDAVNADTVFILPNNKNIFLVAERAAEMTEDKKIIVIHSAQFTQGFTAMMVYDETLAPEENAAAMEEAITGVTTLSFTRAVRDAEIDGLSIKDGEVLGLVGGKVKSVAGEIPAALAALMEHVSEPAFISVYCGADAVPEITAKVEEMLRTNAPDAELMVLDGGQPLYDYVIAVE